MDNGSNMKNIFIIGSKGVPANYGGYETFVDKLTEYHQNTPDIKYHVACIGDGNSEFEYHNARCFCIKVPNIGPAKAILYDLYALKACCKYIKKNNIENATVYVLACRIGPFFNKYVKKIHKLGGKVYVNPDGHEWLRAKWSKPVRSYWKYSEKLMVKHSDLMVCDSLNIEKYIRETYKKFSPKTVFIAYGTEIRKSLLRDDDEKLVSWFKQKGLSPYNYYLVVGRFVPENNYETMIREFMKSKTQKDFALITNVDDKFLAELKKRTGFDKDGRIKFVGTVYDKELLMKIREQAYAYFHGHEVGGTNPSLLEALASTQLNLLLDVGFNREVAQDCAVYWTKEEGDLAKAIENADNLSNEERLNIHNRALSRMRDNYSWQEIGNRYLELFTEN